MKLWLLSILGGIALAPVGGIVGLAIVYGVLYLRRVSEHEGRRGFLAFLLGFLPGLPLGFYAGFRIAWLLSGSAPGPWRRLVLAAMVSLLGMIAASVPAMIGGVHLAEARGVSHYAGERAAWALFYIALPAAAVLGGGGFLLGWWLAG